jgi:hypothetical protein
MKRKYILYILLLALVILSGCVRTQPPSATPGQPSLIYDVFSPGQIGQIEETPSRLDGLYERFDTALLSKDYTLALTIVNQLIDEFPDEKDIYITKARMLIEGITFYQNELNELIEEYDVNSKNYYDDLSTIKAEYEDADIPLVMPGIPDSSR